ncbi:MAG TPA: TetR/AcrR family transcriptional regulator [Kofleriaceae bacterium]|nr:TetR/AcrR family transcriptional regulator [Kofleriaceae bacterium]
MPRTFPSGLTSKKALLPPSAGGDGTRRRILEVALQLFARDSFHGASIRDLARALELQPSALYAHFSSKEHVLAELVRAGHEVHLDSVRGALLAAGADPVDQMKAIVRAHARFHAGYPHLAIVVNEELHALPAELAAPAVALRGQATALMVDVVQRGIDMGRFKPTHAAAAAAAIGAMGLRIPYWHDPSSDLDSEQLAEVQVDLVLRMLGGA